MALDAQTLQKLKDPNAQRWIQAMTQAQRGLTLSPEQELQIGTQKQGINSQYRTDLLQNNYQRGTAQSEQAMQMRDLTARYGNMRQKMPYAANRRGLLTSGIYGQGLQDYAQHRMRDVGDLLQRQQRELGQYDVIRKQIEGRRAAALANIDAQRQSWIASRSQGVFG